MFDVYINPIFSFGPVTYQLVFVHKPTLTCYYSHVIVRHLDSAFYFRLFLLTLPDEHFFQFFDL